LTLSFAFSKARYIQQKNKAAKTTNEVKTKLKETYKQNQTSLSKTDKGTLRKQNSFFLVNHKQNSYLQTTCI
jgi:hypothetical protein